MRTAIFDMLGTFFSLEPLRQRLTALGAPEHTLELWFAEAQRDYLAISHAGSYAPFTDVLAATLPRTIAQVGKGSQDPARHELVLKGLKVLNPAEGAVEALDRLQRAEFRILALTNGSEEATRALLERAGVLHRFADVFSADSARTAKPHRDVYALAGDELEGETWMITAHAWDVLGARRAGMKTAWVSRREKKWLSVLPEPELTAPDLLGCAALLEARMGEELHPSV